MKGINFVAIDFETANEQRSSICEAGICVVKNGEIRETQSWFVHPEDNRYNSFNIRIHGIKPYQTLHAPEFPEVWQNIRHYLQDCPVLVAHNAIFDMSCIRQSLELYGIGKPDITTYCSCRAARKLYTEDSNGLENLCNHFAIPQGTHHRAGDDAEMCARLFLHEIADAHCHKLEEMDFCQGKL